MKNLPLVKNNLGIRRAMRIIDDVGIGIAFIIDKHGKFLGVTTDGDIRKHIIRGGSLNKDVGSITNTQPLFIRKGWSEKKIFEYLRGKRIKAFPLGSICLPIVDGDWNVVGAYHYSESLKKGKSYQEQTPSSIRRVLVIGGAGYIGSVLCRKLLKRGFTVRVLDNLTYGDQGIAELKKLEKFELIQADMRDLQEVMESLKDVDAVIHLAAIVGDPASNVNPQKTIEINYLSTKLVAEACRYHQINRFLFASTCSVYGTNNRQGKLVDETSKPHPISLYAEMKLKSEEALIEMMDENFSPTIFRLATVYGWSPRMRFDLVVNLMTAKAVFDNKISIFGGGQWRPLVSVNDVAEAFIAAMVSPIRDVRGEIFNLGSEEQNYTVRDIGGLVHKSIPGTRIEFTKGEDKRSYRVDFKKIRAVLKFRPKTKIGTEIRKMKNNIKVKITDYLNPKYNNQQVLLSYNSSLKNRGLT